MVTPAPIQDAEIVPTTVGQYVQAKFGYWARRWVGIISIGVPAMAAVRMRTYGNAADWILPAIGAWALCCVAALLVILLTLSVGGWWHTRRYRH
ncbi:hypothetical protein MKP15_04350 [Stenotrophomonas sp. Y6]|uniref:hypothetical protein n=1 Tax=Stenotrophomonas sp. Y6 TaxID=2920383 RepID=UPI001F06080C|nr:hypothetical protein [Stenotrophomonas sp. Y6]MCH1908004.1 hypothetical protein [Stenotrophomonas sp. Y6]